MEKMLTEVCHEVNNYFRRDIHSQRFSVEGGIINGIPDGFLQDGQYFRIVGSVFNDGVYKMNHSEPSKMNLRDEDEFSGSIWSLGIPQEFLDLASEISDWQTAYGGTNSAALSPFSSESFGGYSYSKSGAGSASDGSSDGSNWKTVFAPRLSKWRRKRGII